jgi:hypothetical protein
MEASSLRFSRWDLTALTESRWAWHFTHSLSSIHLSGSSCAIVQIFACRRPKYTLLIITLRAAVINLFKCRPTYRVQ